MSDNPMPLSFDRFEPPDARERCVEKLQPAVGAEHRDAFLERVERRLLHLDERVVGTLEPQLIADVLIEKDQSAEGMGLRYHPQGFAARNYALLIKGPPAEARPTLSATYH